MIKKGYVEPKRWLTDFEGNLEYKDFPESAKPLFDIQTVESVDRFGWKSYVVEMEDGRCMIYIESYIMSSCQAEEFNIPIGYFKRYVTGKVKKMALAFPDKDIYLGFEDGDPTIGVLLPDVKSQAELLAFAEEIDGIYDYVTDRLVKNYRKGGSR